MGRIAKIMREYRKVAVFLLAVFAALITESTDAVSMILVWLPLCLVYELIIFGGSFWESKETK